MERTKGRGRTKGKVRPREGRSHGHRLSEGRREDDDGVAGSGEVGSAKDDRARQEREREKGDKSTRELSENGDLTKQRIFMRVLKKQSAQRRRMLMREVVKWCIVLHLYL